MIKSSEALELYSPYLDAPVGNYLTVPALPDVGPLVLNELTSPANIAEHARVLVNNEATGMAVIDKKFPHAIREVMWLHSEIAPIPTLTDYLATDGTGKRSSELFLELATCAAAAEEAGSDYVSLSWSSDPDTHHRPSIQGEKRLHFHLTSRNGELDALPEVTTRISNLSFVDKRRLAEEYSFVTTTYLSDIFKASPELGITTTPIHPCVLSMEIGDWPDLAKPGTLEKLAIFLDVVEEQYNGVIDCIGHENEYGVVSFSDAIDPYECVKDISGLDESSLGLTLLSSYVDQLRATCKQELAASLPRKVSSDLQGHKKLIYTALTPSKGMSYAGNFSKHEGILYFHFRPTKFSDLGGAGCAFLKGMPVRMKKGAGHMSAEQLSQREQFVTQNVAIVADMQALRSA